MGRKKRKVQYFNNLLSKLWSKWIYLTLILNSFSQSEDEHGRPARKRGSVRFGKDVRSDVSRLVSLFLIIIPLHPTINTCILHTILFTTPMELTRRIYLTVKNFLNWWSFPLFLWLTLLIQWWYCKEKWNADHFSSFILFAGWPAAGGCEKPKKWTKSPDWRNWKGKGGEGKVGFISRNDVHLLGLIRE